MKQAFLENKWFLYPYILILILCGYILMHFSKSEIHIFCNQHYSAFGDLFFKYITNLGNGIFMPLYILIILFVRYRYAFLLAFVFLVSGIAVQLAKHLFFSDVYRPVKYFAGIYKLHLVSGVHQFSFHSFPSGHSATAFGIFLCFAMISKRNWVKLLMFISASVIAYSRVYLSQHFLSDIVAGSVIGVLVAILSYPWIHHFNKPWLDQFLHLKKHISNA